MASTRLENSIQRQKLSRSQTRYSRIVSSISTISCVEYCFQGEATTQSFRWMNHPSWLDRSKDFDTLLSSLARAHRLSESGSLKRLFWRSHSSFNKASFAAKGPVLHRSHFLCRKKEKRDCILLGNRMGGKRGDEENSSC